MVAASVVVIPTTAAAAPGTVVAYRGVVHERPDDSSPVVSTLAQYAPVSISADLVTPGWREAVLPGGSVGYIRDDAVVPAGATPSVVVVEPPVDPRHEATTWFGLGAGSARFGGHDGLGLDFEIASGVGRRFLSLGFAFMTEVTEPCLFCSVPQPQESNKELTLRYGVRARWPWVAAWTAVGLAAVWTVQRGAPIPSSSGGGGIIIFPGPDLHQEIDRFTVGATACGGVALSGSYFAVGPAVRATLDTVRSSGAILPRSSRRIPRCPVGGR
jgi:hypothetical protein